MMVLKGKLKEVFPQLIEEFNGCGLDQELTITNCNNPDKEQIDLVFTHPDYAQKFLSIIGKTCGISVNRTGITLRFSYEKWEKLNEALEAIAESKQVEAPNNSVKTLGEAAAASQTAQTAQITQAAAGYQVEALQSLTQVAAEQGEVIGYVWRTAEVPEQQPVVDESCCRRHCTLI